MSVEKARCKETKENEMDDRKVRCKITIGGTQLVMSMEEAVKVFTLLNGVDISKIDYDYIEGKSYYHLKEAPDFCTLQTLSEEDYSMWILYSAARRDKNE